MTKESLLQTIHVLAKTYRWSPEEILLLTNEDIEFLYGLIQKDNEREKAAAKSSSVKKPRRRR